MIRSWGEPGSAGPSPDRVEPGEDELRIAYERYRTRQARRLVGLLPREAIRPLYRAARNAPDLDVRVEDPLGLLASYCAHILPLPPFRVWAEDVRRNPEAHLAELAEAADAPTVEAPATLEARLLTLEAGSGWVARLRAFRDHDTWRGFIAFEEQGSGAVHRTALIFRESDPRHLRRRFLEFEPGALEAFLRSSIQSPSFS